MAQRPVLRVVEDTFDDFMDPEDGFFDNPEEALIEEVLEDEEVLGIELDEAVDELVLMVKDAINFIETEMYPIWEDADRYMNGESDLKSEVGRSSLVMTVIRDAVRSLKPNMMRVFLQSTTLCQFVPANVLDYGAAAIAQGQTSYANSLFWSSGGYLSLLNGVHNALTKKAGIFKAMHMERRNQKYMELSSVTIEQFEAVSNMPDIEVISAEEDPVTGLLRIEVVQSTPAGEIVLSDVNLHEFIVDDGATTPEDAAVIGERRSISVTEAIDMGLSYGAWEELDDDTLEEGSGRESAMKRRGYTKGKPDEDSEDPSKHRFLLTQVYAKFDLEGTGTSQLYLFSLGGTEFTYLAHERVSENPYAVALADPVPGAFFGTSLPEILKEDQNAQTSILRAAADNAHSVNNRRIAFHDTLVNGHDVMSKVIGAPIRFRQPGMIQEIGVESTLGTMIPFLDYLKTMSQDKVGTTNASLGLDPDALQSTDKDAVRNTIQLAQGQIELMCRNIAETGIAPVFRKLLRLSMRHRPRAQQAFVNGFTIPLDQYAFDADMLMQPNVGLGTGSIDTRMMALQQIAAKQQEIIAEFGLNNPICGLAQAMNTVVDMGTLSGITNMGRYFSQITPELAAQLDQMAAQKAAQAQPEPPSAAITQAEQIRGQSRLMDRQMQVENDQKKTEAKNLAEIIRMLMEDDFKRDQMAQNLAIDAAKTGLQEQDKARVRQEQLEDRQHGDKMMEAELFLNTLRDLLLAQQQQQGQAVAPQPAPQQGPQGVPSSGPAQPLLAQNPGFGGM